MDNNINWTDISRAMSKALQRRFPNYATNGDVVELWPDPSSRPTADIIKALKRNPESIFLDPAQSDFVAALPKILSTAEHPVSYADLFGTALANQFAKVPQEVAKPAAADLKVVETTPKPAATTSSGVKSQTAAPVVNVRPESRATQRSAITERLVGPIDNDRAGISIWSDPQAVRRAAPNDSPPERDHAATIEVLRPAPAQRPKDISGVPLDTLYAAFAAKLANPRNIFNLKKVVDEDARALKSRGRADVYEFNWQLLSHLEPLLLRSDLVEVGETLISLYASTLSQIKRVNVKPLTEQTEHLENLMYDLMQGKGVGASEDVQKMITGFPDLNHYFIMRRRALAGRQRRIPEVEPVIRRSGTPRHFPSAGREVGDDPMTAEKLDRMTRQFSEICREATEEQKVKPASGDRLSLKGTETERISALLDDIKDGVAQNAAFVQKAPFSRLLFCAGLFHNKDLDERLIELVISMGDANPLVFQDWPYPVQKLEQLLRDDNTSENARAMMNECYPRWKAFSIEPKSELVQRVEARMALRM